MIHSPVVVVLVPDGCGTFLLSRGSLHEVSSRFRCDFLMERDVWRTEHMAAVEVQPLQWVTSSTLFDSEGHMSSMLASVRWSHLRRHKNSCCTQRISEPAAACHLDHHETSHHTLTRTVSLLLKQL